ncbi:DUF3267 domain-containing protein [Methanoculleus sp. FWC-SCC1]|uniref:DUF3267 domain-containing protein n=1 Tax=Methanoculleus frigidifontis TaxID=2584085 RepID=A0ABT8MAE0_9EURY|nr:DUF3267 domain-containing protein [Methanoculleus sp. FWC-SCC1]MDN7024869.1 DUF3267 domain-containing protein [Methanoculleus sp. FWC-SCC1]
MVQPAMQEIGRLDLSTKRNLILLQVAGFIVLLAAGFLALQAAILLRPDIPAEASFTLSGSEGLAAIAAALAVLIGATTVLVAVHEGVHALFFWLVTGKRPYFGVTGFYAYVGAPPGVAITRNRYLGIALAPLLVVTLAGLLLLPAVPLIALPPLLLLLILNAAGSVGDLIASCWLLRYPPSVLVGDQGVAVVVIRPA